MPILWSVADGDCGLHVSSHSLCFPNSHCPSTMCLRDREAPCWVWAPEKAALPASFQTPPPSGYILLTQAVFPLQTDTVPLSGQPLPTPLHGATFIPPLNALSYPRLTHPSTSSSTFSSPKPPPLATLALLIFLFLLKYNLTLFVCITIYHPFFPL